MKNPVETLLHQRGGGEKDDLHASRLRLPGPQYVLKLCARSLDGCSLVARNEFGPPQMEARYLEKGTRLFILSHGIQVGTFFLKKSGAHPRFHALNAFTGLFGQPLIGSGSLPTIASKSVRTAFARSLDRL